MRQYEPLVGDFVGPSIVALVALARDCRETVFMDFNGVRIYADRKSKPAKISAWWKENERQQLLAYRSSPEGIAQAEADRIRRYDLETKSERLMSRLGSLDFTDLEQLLGWFEELESSAGLGWFNRRKVLKAFKQHGFRANDNLDPYFKSDDRENYARYLIGQGLSFIGSWGYVHQIYLKFLAEWRAKFTTLPAA